jgi:hypothetical protein
MAQYGNGVASSIGGYEHRLVPVSVFPNRRRLVQSRREVSRHCGPPTDVLVCDISVDIHVHSFPVVLGSDKLWVLDAPLVLGDELRPAASFTNGLH